MKTGTINGETYSIPDGYQVIRADEYDRLCKWATLVSDLDRNFEGRHQRDVSSGEPSGVSQGNPLFPPGAHIGYTLHASHKIVVPEREQRHDPDAWLR